MINTVWKMTKELRMLNPTIVFELDYKGEEVFIFKEETEDIILPNGFYLCGTIDSILTNKGTTNENESFSCKVSFENLK